MPRVPVYNMEGEQIGEIELSEAIFGLEPNVPLMHAAVTQYLANQRLGTANTKTRGEVSGGGRKPWRQKGTGRARQGSIRAPHWRGGGIVFGPKQRSYRMSMPKKARRAALRSALSSKASEGRIWVIDDLAVEQPSTKTVRQMLRNLAIDGETALLVPSAGDRLLYLSARNLPGVETAALQNLNTYQVLRHTQLILSRDAVERAAEVWG